MVAAIQCRIHAPDAYSGPAIANRCVNALKLPIQITATARHVLGSLLG